MDELRRSSLEILRKQYQRMGGVFSLLGAFGAKDSRIIRYDTRDSCIKIRGGRVWWKELQCALLRQGGLKIGYVERVCRHAGLVVLPCHRVACGNRSTILATIFRLFKQQQQSSELQYITAPRKSRLSLAPSDGHFVMYR